MSAGRWPLRRGGAAGSEGAAAGGRAVIVSGTEFRAQETRETRTEITGSGESDRVLMLVSVIVKSIVANAESKWGGSGTPGMH